MCERYILHMLAPGALAHYELFKIAAHRTVFFDVCRYVLRVETPARREETPASQVETPAGQEETPASQEATPAS